MEVKVKRKTGFIGVVMKVSLLVDGELVKKLDNGEEYLIQTEKEMIKVRTKQGISGSKEFEITHNANIEIKMNPVFFWIWIVGLVLLFFTAITETRELKFIFAAVGISDLIFNLFYSIRSSFIFKVNAGTTEE